MEWNDNSEQFYQKKKSDFVEDDEAGNRIMHGLLHWNAIELEKNLMPS